MVSGSPAFHATAARVSWSSFSSGNTRAMKIAMAPMARLFLVAQDMKLSAECFGLAAAASVTGASKKIPSAVGTKPVAHCVAKIPSQCCATKSLRDNKIKFFANRIFDWISRTRRRRRRSIALNDAVRIGDNDRVLIHALPTTAARPFLRADPRQPLRGRR